MDSSTPTPQNQPQLTPDEIPGATNDVVKELMGEPATPPATPPQTPPPAPAQNPSEPPPTPEPQDGPPEIPDTLLDQPPATPPPADPDDDFDPNSIEIETLDEKVRPNFAKMRDKLNAIQRELEAATQERDVLKNAQTGEITESDAYKNLQEENQKLLDLVARTNLSSDPRFIAKYETMSKPITDSIKAALQSYNIDGLNVDKAVEIVRQLTPAERSTWVTKQFPEELHGAAIAALLPMFSQYDIIDRNREAELAAHKESKAVLDQQHKTQTEEQLSALKEEFKTKALRDISQKEVLLKRVDGNDAWNQAVDSINESINAIFTSKNPQEHANAFVSAALAPVYKAMFNRERAKRVAYENAIKARNITLPDVGKGTAQTKPTPKKIEDLTVDEAVKLTLPAGLR